MAFVMKRTACLAIVPVLLLLAGCTNYYRVTDLATDQDYYTTRVHRRSSGALEFKDSRTGSDVTLTSSKITKVNKEEFKYGKTSR
jgi:hypothetical protein